MSKENNHGRRRLLGATAASIAAGQIGTGRWASAQSAANSPGASETSAELSRRVPQMRHAAARLRVEGQMPSLRSATAWVNSSPITTDNLRGKVVLVQFWTYTCINWRRSLPYVRAWAKRYRDQGLVVIGVHTPEFSFEKSLDNVRQAVKDIRIDYPVAVDSNYQIWRAFNNEYWPALYFVDVQGNVRHHKFGEGEYEQSEAILQQLLAEAGMDGGEQQPVSLDARGAEAAPDWSNLRSQEICVGYLRTANFASPGGAVLGRRHLYAAPARLRLNDWALSGYWTMNGEGASLDQPGGRIAYCFHARDLHLVLGPLAPETSGRYRVLIDGQPPGAAHGVDADGQGEGTVTEPRMYQLVRQSRPILDRQFEIEFLDPAVAAYCFTFG